MAWRGRVDVIGEFFGITISSDITSEISEGSKPPLAQGFGRSITIHLNGGEYPYDTYWIAIVPKSGSYDDFWNVPNLLHNESAPATYLDVIRSSFALDDYYTFYLNADSKHEGDETFTLGLFSDFTDARYGSNPIFTYDFVVKDDDGTAAADRLAGTAETDFLRGFGGNDVLSGLAGNDRLEGGDGKDRLSGGTGNDYLVGGSGADTFIFSSKPNAKLNLDTIADFQHGAGDTIQLNQAIFKSITHGGGLLAEEFFSGAGAKSAHDVSDRIIYDTTSGTLWYDADGIGGAAAVPFARIQGYLTRMVDHTDILILA